MKNSEKSQLQFLSPFNLKQVETAYNNARNYADLLAVDDAMSKASLILQPLFAISEAPVSF